MKRPGRRPPRSFQARTLEQLVANEVEGGAVLEYLDAMKQFLSLGLALVLGMGITWAQSNPLLGKWKTKDDETGRIKSIVEITERDGKFYGTVVELFRLPEEEQDPYCDLCEDDRKDQRVLGMEIVRDMEFDEKWEWEDGTICDPKKGSVYDCEMWFEEGDLNTLKVRGYILFLFRTQEWYRVTE
ncbi:MAG: hypothetical protein RLZZ314_1527 [Bacteroidota bacterium]